MDPTHTGANGRSSLIDLVLLSSSEKLANCSVIPPLENSVCNVRNGILLSIKTRPYQTARLPHRTIWRYSHEKANRLLESLDMNSIIDSNDIDHCWEN